MKTWTVFKTQNFFT